MAGDWIKWTKGLASRREVAVLSAALGRDRHEIAGRLMVLWEWCDDNATEADADLSLNVSLHVGDRPCVFLDAIAGLPGLAEAMTAPGVGWLAIGSAGEITFPRFARHNGNSAKTRASEANKKRRQRSRPVVVPEMSRSSRDTTGTREEKRREESKEEGAEPPKPAASAPPLSTTATKATKPKAPADASAETEPIPTSLDVPPFRSAWAAWIAERKTRRKPLTANAARLQLASLEPLGPASATACVNRSIERGWQGLFPDQFAAGFQQPPTPTRPATTALDDATVRANLDRIRRQNAGENPAPPMTFPTTSRAPIQPPARSLPL